ncbi:MAG: murein peptide amidase [Solirubrobacteraceae bacterium]|nr:murein peptide amidase [Solirubrobacteraceae bacterium]
MRVRGVPAMAAAVLVVGAAAPAAHASRTVRVGRSVLGRPITAVVVGPRDAAHNVLVVGDVHGNEPAGIAITTALRSQAPPPGTALWLVRSFNPDGLAAGTRQNAHGVDLNRQAPYRWRHLPRGPFYAGPRPLSEPESRAAVGLIRRLRPVVTIWYHQHAALVDDHGGDRALERRYARMVGLPFRRIPGRYPGSLSIWQDHALPHTTAFVVELPAGALAPAAVRRHVRAVLTAARSSGRAANA